MKKYNEWLAERDVEDAGSNDFGMKTDPDLALVDEQSQMMMQRFVGLLHSLTPEQKSAVVEKAIKSLRQMIG